LGISLKNIKTHRNEAQLHFYLQLLQHNKAQQFFLVAVTQHNFHNPVSKSNKAQNNFCNCGGWGSCALQNTLRSAQLCLIST